MCFSPQISFATALALAITGSITRAQALPNFKRFATTPWLFAIQQAAEGMVWLSLLYWPETSLNIFFSYIFLFFAYIIWPVWVPWSLETAESNDHARSTLRIMRYVGTFFSFGALIFMLNYGVNSELVQCHIAYTGGSISSAFQYFALAIYLIPVVGSFFVSTIRYGTIAGILIATSCLASYMIWYMWFGSVWCFFAAALNIGILFML